MELVTTYLCKTSDIGVHSNVFGGRLISIIDESSAAYAAQICDTPRMVTLKISELLFEKPARKGRIDTSTVIHKLDLCVNYGLWKDRNEGGYAHDWEFFSRWREEKYIPSKQFTLLYNTDLLYPSILKHHNTKPVSNGYVKFHI